MNQYPLWKYLLIVVVVIAGLVYALPNLYGEDPAVQISPLRATVIDEEAQMRFVNTLRNAQIDFTAVEKVQDKLFIRFADTSAQLKARDVLTEELGEDYVAALTLLPATPGWLAAIDADPMYLGLDLRGGVHFLMEVDMDAAVRQAEERYVSDIRAILRAEKIRYLSLARKNEGGIEVKFRSEADRDKADDLIAREFQGLERKNVDRDGGYFMSLTLSDQELRDIKKFAVQQNIITLRKRVNELGVAEPVIQQQGVNRIVVQLPGVQDPARAKEILGATATLEYRLVDETGSIEDALAGQVPVGSRLYKQRNGEPILLKKRVIVTGDQIIDASSGIDQQTGSPAVYVTLDSKGAKKMGDITKNNVGKGMAVVFIENKPQTRIVDGKKIKTTRTVQEVINVATIRDHFSKRFQTTGLDSTEEARKLALLLRAGALAAPIEIVEERTVGPSLGQENISQGFRSVIIGFVLVLAFMAFWYRAFGMVANLALALNLVLIVAVLSMLQATLTLPGIAGIVLTVGMAVDANVLIFERIREELRNGNSPQASISAGYGKALSTIADANITTLIAAVVLYSFGTGPIKGFAVTLSIGILTSMFTAIMGTRAVVNLMYGGRKVDKLAI
ncbi:MAG TPA: protein translocase subunit SecD [Gammaproteobacteria bacterium]|nr:protein translocase subunit SecD [Gammaproteobacteria bacterium]